MDGRTDGQRHGRTTRKHIASAGAYRRRRLKNFGVSFMPHSVYRYRGILLSLWVSSDRASRAETTVLKRNNTSSPNIRHRPHFSALHSTSGNLTTENVTSIQQPDHVNTSTMQLQLQLHQIDHTVPDYTAEAPPRRRPTGLQGCWRHTAAAAGTR